MLEEQAEERQEFLMAGKQQESLAHIAAHGGAVFHDTADDKAFIEDKPAMTAKHGWFRKLGSVFAWGFHHGGTT